MDYSGSGALKGTLFRVPLRTQALAESSKLSSTVFSPKKVEELIAGFVSFREQYLLFLRHLQKIEILVWEEDSPSPQLLFSTCCKSTPSASALRSEVLGTPGGVSSLFKIDLQTKLRSGSVFEETRSTWLVCSRHGGSSAILNFTEDKKVREAMKCIPLCAAAVPLSGVAPIGPPTPPFHPLASPNFCLDFLQLDAGRLFVGLPTTISSNMPVHLNGMFELEPSRLSLWTQTGVGEASLRVKWNELLMTDLVAPLFVDLLVTLRSELHSRLEKATSSHETETLFATPFRFLADPR